jgi:hypothetical protein
MRRLRGIDALIDGCLFRGRDEGAVVDCIAFGFCTLDSNAAFSGQDTRSVNMIWLATWPIG